MSNNTNTNNNTTDISVNDSFGKVEYNVVIPMAGLGSRFKDFGFKSDKFLLPINAEGTIMLKAAVDTLCMPRDKTEYIFVLLEQHYTPELIKYFHGYRVSWVVLDNLTNGPATSAQYGVGIISNDKPILVSNCDQILENWNSLKFINACSGYDGGVLTYKPSYELCTGAVDKHSFVLLNNETGDCMEFAEKKVLSNIALVGVHYFRSKEVFIKAYQDMVSKHEVAPNGEYYLSLMYNSLVRQGMRVKQHGLDKHEKFIPVGEPNDYFTYINPIFGPRPFHTNNGTIMEFDSDLIIEYNTYSTRVPCCYINVHDNTVSTSSTSVDDIRLVSSVFRSFKGTVDLTLMKSGWFVGDFEPSIVRTTLMDIGYLTHHPGEKWDFHTHYFSREYNFLVSGKMSINGITYKSGSKFMFDYRCMACPKFYEKCTILCVKFPSAPRDKVVY